MNYKQARRELKLINRPGNAYLYYRAISIIQGIASGSTDKNVLKKMNFHLEQLQELENPFNFDKTLKSKTGLMKLIDIVGEVESYLQSIE